MSVGAILLCAGKGERLGLGVDKALVPLAGRPLFIWSLESLERSGAIDGVVAVGPVKKLQQTLAACGFGAAKIVAWCEGGKERQDSVRRGLEALPAHFDWVAVHDCARVLVSAPLIARVVADALTYGAAIAALPLEDTLKRGSLGAIETTVSRAGLWRAQTPQVFRRDWLESAHAQATGKATDDAALIESQGHPVHLTEGDPLNFKVTTAGDLQLAEAWLASRTART
jgi:2-C-methyl-D-erythritol 4-phosphate cytidylyltransferase